MDVEGLGQKDGGDGPGDAERAHDDEGQHPPVHGQVNYVGEGEESDAGYERGDAHRLGSQHRRQQLTHEHVEHSKRGGDAEFTDHRQ